MLQSTESDCPSHPNFSMIQHAMAALKQNIAAHLESELRLERLYQGWQQTWMTQFNQLRAQIETLEARLSPWIVEPIDSPRLSVVPQAEDIA